MTFLSFNGVSSKYPSRRSVVYGNRGMVCTSQALAAQAGLDVLKKGGNAIDAAIATAVSLTVLEPPSNGIGSDLFALVWYHGRLYGLNGSGPAPMGLSREVVLHKLGCVPEIAKRDGDSAANKIAVSKCTVKSDGSIPNLSASAMPDKGWETVTIPGAPASWKALHDRFGAADFASLFGAAIQYAEEGYPLQPICSYLWKKNAETVVSLKNSSLYQPMLKTFFKDKKFDPGQVIRLPEMGRTLRELAGTGCASFYRGGIAREIAGFAKETGGYMT